MQAKTNFRAFLKDMLYIFYKPFRVGYPIELKQAVNGCESLLDVGCGSSSPIKEFSKSMYTVGVDIFERDVNESKKQGIHNEYYVLDALDIDKRFKNKSFDCVAALGIIEHLDKESGIELLTKMEKIARKKVILFMPNGFVPQGTVFGNPFQAHKSAWYVDEMKQYGYNVVGVNGWKPLRKAEGKIKYPPEIFWAGVSRMSDVLVRNHPKHAFELFCVKTIGEK